MKQHKSTLLKAIAGLLKEDKGHIVKGSVTYNGDTKDSGKFSLPKVAHFAEQASRDLFCLLLSLSNPRTCLCHFSHSPTSLGSLTLKTPLFVRFSSNMTREVIPGTPQGDLVHSKELGQLRGIEKNIRPAFRPGVVSLRFGTAPCLVINISPLCPPVRPRPCIRGSSTCCEKVSLDPVFDVSCPWACSVRQTDRHLPTMTVQETFKFAFDCMAAGTHGLDIGAGGKPLTKKQEELVSWMDEKGLKVTIFRWRC